MSESVCMKTLYVLYEKRSTRPSYRKKKNKLKPTLLATAKNDLTHIYQKIIVKKCPKHSSVTLKQF